MSEVGSCRCYYAVSNNRSRKSLVFCFFVCFFGEGDGGGV